MYAYCGNNPIARKDSSGQWWNVVIGAVVGGVIGAASTMISRAMDGKEIRLDEVLLSAACGAVAGALAATGIGGVAGQMFIGAATSFIDSGYQNYNDYKDGDKTMGEAIGCTLVDTSVGALVGAMGTTAPDSKAAFKVSNQVSGAYYQAKKVLRQAVLHPKTRAAAKAAVKIGTKYLAKTIGSTFAESTLNAVVSVGISKLSNLYIVAIG